MQVLILDNYDSFTYNLVQAFLSRAAEVTVVRNDQVSVEEVEAMSPDRIVISPGPGTPERAGISVALVRAMAGRVPILGVCLGHQAIAVASGAQVVRADRPMHGKTSWIHHDDRGVFAGCPQPFEANRYHSLIVDEPSLPPCFEVSARTEQGEIMGLRLRGVAAPVEGVQFHPESYLTRSGNKILSGFLAEPVMELTPS